MNSDPVASENTGLRRSIGRWSFTALIINCIIGSGIFGVPGELIATVGRASPLVMIVAGLFMGIILLCIAEVGSRFAEPGGVYVYVRTAFGSLVGLQIAWFWFLSVLGSAAASANLFVAHLSGLWPSAGHGPMRVAVVTGLLFIPACLNYCGTRKGTFLSNGLTLAKLLPLVLLVVLGLIRFSHRVEIPPVSELTSPGWSAWVNALLLLSFTYGGFEDALAPTGEVREPRRTIPLGLITALVICMSVYTLLQFVVVATLGTVQTDRPLAATAQVLAGPGGALFVELAAMISTYGWLSASMLNVPRFLYALAEHREFPLSFGKLHRRFGTPHISILAFASLAWALAVTGSYRWCLVLSAAAGVVFYAAVCAALPRLRRIRASAALFELPMGRLFSILGVGICVVLLTRLQQKEALLMTITILIALINWWCVRHRSVAALEQSVALARTEPAEIPPAL